MSTSNGRPRFPTAVPTPPNPTHVDPAQIMPPPRSTSAAATLAPNGANKPRNHVWTRDETDRLVNALHGNIKYQLALMPGRVTKEQEKGLKISKMTICCEIFREVFGDTEQPEPQRIKTKIATLTQTYNSKKAALGHTGAGMLFEEVGANTEQYQRRTELQMRVPWFERWHEMAIDCPAATPSQIFTAGSYDDNNNARSPSQQDMDEDDDDDDSDDDDEDMPEHGRSLPSLDQVAASSSRDPMAARMLPSATPSRSTPATPSRLASGLQNGRRQRSRSVQEDDDGDDINLEDTPARSPAKRSRGLDRRDTMLEAIRDAQADKHEKRRNALAKAEEEKTKRQEIKLKREELQIAWEREKADREEKLKRELAELAEREKHAQCAAITQMRRVDREELGAWFMGMMKRGDAPFSPPRWFDSGSGLSLGSGTG